MQFYATISSTDDFHNMQFILQARGIDGAMSKAHMIAEHYQSGYDVNSITVMDKPDVHTINEVGQCMVTASKRGVYGRVGVRLANRFNDGGGYGAVHIVTI